MSHEQKIQSKMIDVFDPKAIRVANHVFFYLLAPYSLFIVFEVTLSKEHTLAFSDLQKFFYAFDYISGIFLVVICGIYYLKVKFGNLSVLLGITIATIASLMIAPGTYKEYISALPVVFFLCAVNLILIVYVLHSTRIAEIKVYKK